MKTEKKTKNSKKRVVKEPEFIVDLTNAKTPSDVYLEFAVAKQRAGKPLTDDELKTIVDYVICKTLNDVKKIISELPYKEISIEGDEKIIMDANGNVKIKKPNIFRRFWNWIRRK